MRLRPCNTTAALAGVLLVIGASICPALGQESVPAGLGEPPLSPAAEPIGDVPYEASLVGASGELEEMIERASRLIALADRPPGSLAALRQRIENDRDIVQDALRALGYYAGAVTVTADETRQPVGVTIDVTPGPRFVLTSFQVRSQRPDPSLPPLEIPLTELGIELGQPARTAEILAAESGLIAAFARRAYPLAEVIDRQVVVDHAARGVGVDILVDTGPFARFGQVEIRGLRDVGAELVLNRLPWEVGTPFDLGLLEQARLRLLTANLFSSIRLTPADALGPDGLLPVIVEVEERKHRTVGGTVNWNSNKGFGTEAYWEHRNLFAAGERLHVGAFMNELGFGTTTAFRNPDYWGRDWDLVADIQLEDVETDAYDTSTASISFGADLHLTSMWRVTALGAVEYSVETENGRERRFTLLSTPVVATRDTTDDLLDPTRGGRLSLRFTPYYAASGDVDDFLQLEIGDSIYYQVWEEPRVILAGWADLGAIIGGSLEGIPAQKRFYAGGGGSIRAFAYQLAGPLDASNDPTGGLSLLAFGGEARINVTESIGIVPFVEAGTVFDERYPDFSEELLWGAGLGFRYYTGIGPIRADIAIPINPRDTDDRFQVYLSFGQAF